MEGGSLGMSGGGGDIASRPAIGFPLGSALLLLVIFCFSGAFSCCYHWNKLKTFFPCGHRSIPAASFPSSPLAIPSPCMSSPFLQEKKLEERLSLPVVMPGDSFPKYIAWPCQPSPRALPMDKMDLHASSLPISSIV